MVFFAKRQDNFLKILQKEPRKVVVYGAGTASRIAFPYFPRVECFCDKDAKKIGTFQQLPVLLPVQLEEINEAIYLLVCVNKREKTIKSIEKTLKALNINAVVFNYFDNDAFNCFKETEHYEAIASDKKLRVRLVSYDEGWILGKFADRMNKYLLSMGIDSDIGNCIDPHADINHHIAHHKYEPVMDCNDTLMITHVDCKQKLDLLKHQLTTAKMGICMSKDTLEKMTMYGVPRDKLCYINPAHDGLMKPKKYVLGITHKTHVDIDYRKNPKVILEMCNHISPAFFSFKIMGSGWDIIVDEIKKMGFQVDYYSEFDYNTYMELIPSLDFYLFYGNDEGSMGYLDALAAGVQTIVTPQGYHLDIQNGITYPCKTVQDFIQTFQQLQKKREDIIHSVEGWTWENYTRKHLEVWKYILKLESIGELYKNQHYHEDGIFSVLTEDVSN